MVVQLAATRHGKDMNVLVYLELVEIHLMSVFDERDGFRVECGLT
jgi:hypothetical protein